MTGLTAASRIREDLILLGSSTGLLPRIVASPFYRGALSRMFNDRVAPS